MNWSARQRHCLWAMGIPLWIRRIEEPLADSVPCHAALNEDNDEDNGRMSELLSSVRKEAMTCTRCSLSEARTHVVFGVGSENADCMVIGEAPGAEEDKKGEPFVGRAGRLLNSMLAAIDLRRADVYIANIIKCRPPKNRDPEPEEAASCRDYLMRQIRCVNPRVIMAVGRVAAQNLLGVTTPVGKMRGLTHRLPGTEVPVIVTYHPAYLLRSPGAKAHAWRDLLQVRALLSGDGG